MSDETTAEAEEAVRMCPFKFARPYSPPREGPMGSLFAGQVGDANCALEACQLFMSDGKCAFSVMASSLQRLASKINLT